MKPHAVPLLALLCLSWVTLTFEPQRAKANPGKPEAAAKTTDQAAPIPSPEQLELQAHELVKVVARMRGLPPRRPVAMGVLSRVQILTEISDRLAEDYTEEEVAAEAAILRQMGLLPRGMSYKQAVLELLSDQVAGFYNPQKRKLHIASWLPLVLQKPTLAHEICHALQDQHFNLVRFVKPSRDNGDSQLSRAALVEGDCTGVMVEYVLAPSGADLSNISGKLGQLMQSMLGAGSEAFRRTPMFLRETLTFPYIYGLQLVEQIRRSHRWSAVSDLFRRPPISTEQILHFDKLTRHERPATITTRPLRALAHYQLIKADTLGEFQLSVYLRQALGPIGASRASAGWDGDRLVAYRQPDGSYQDILIVHLSNWDSEDDAREFRNAQHAVVGKLVGQSRPVSDSGSLLVFSDHKGLQWSVEQRGRAVLTIVAAPEHVREQLQRDVWQAWRIDEPR